MLSSVTAGGPAVNIANGGVYWLIASSNGDLAWNSSLTAHGLRYTDQGIRIYQDYTATFSVQVADSPSTPGPLKRRRKV